MVTALAWSLERMDGTRDSRIAAKLVCSNRPTCKSVMKIPVGGFGGRPEAIRKLFERAGWEVDQHNANRCFCPTCIRGRRGLRESVKITHAEPKQTTLPPPKEAPIAMTDLKMPAVDIKSIPAATKVAIRNRLDSHFDDAKGAYEPGWSDNRIAEELDIPVSQVFAYREMAYGPLKRDPEVDLLLNELEAVRKKLAEVQSDLAKTEFKAQACLKKLGL